MNTTRLKICVGCGVAEGGGVVTVVAGKFEGQVGGMVVVGVVVSVVNVVTDGDGAFVVVDHPDKAVDRDFLAFGVVINLYKLVRNW